MSLMKAVLATLLAGGLTFGPALPATSAPVQTIRFPAVKSADTLPVMRADHRRGHRKNRGYYGKNGRHYYNGHRGYRKHRRGYRRYNGWWYPPAAFSFGFRVAPPQRYIAPPPLVIVPPRARYNAYLSPAHYQWCDQRYRSYRAADNSFQPYHGPRRACLSPYGP